MSRLPGTLDPIADSIFKLEEAGRERGYVIMSQEKAIKDLPCKGKLMTFLIKGNQGPFLKRPIEDLPYIGQSRTFLIKGNPSPKDKPYDGVGVIIRRGISLEPPIRKINWPKPLVEF